MCFICRKCDEVLKETEKFSENLSVTENWLVTGVVEFMCADFKYILSYEIQRFRILKRSI